MPYTLQSVLDDLESRGDDRQLARHHKNGVTAKMFGVLMGQIRKVATPIKHDPALAHQLWDTQILEAQLLATLLFKPKDLSIEQLDQLAGSLVDEPVTHWFSSYLLRKHKDREQVRVNWMASDNVWRRRFGWSLTDQRVCEDASGLDLEALLDQIERTLAGENPHVQWTMNTTLVGIGVHHPALRPRALELGEAIGLYSDYPHQAGCTRPYAPEWIAEMVRRQEG